MTGCGTPVDAVVLPLAAAAYPAEQISRFGPGPLLSGCIGAGGSLLTSWDTGPA